jgi:hypothetical protein
MVADLETPRVSVLTDSSVARKRWKENVFIYLQRNERENAHSSCNNYATIDWCDKNANEEN